MSEFISLLGSFSRDEDSRSNTYTHYHRFDPQKKIRIEQGKYTEFWYNYCEAVKRGEKIYLCEKNDEESMPVIIDFTLTFVNCNNVTEYDELCPPLFIALMISYTQQIIEENFDISKLVSPGEYSSGITPRNYLMCIIQEEDSYNVNREEIRIRKRLQFPYIRIDPKIIKKFIIPSLIRRVQTENLTRIIESAPKNKWEEIIDSSMYDKPVTMFGSYDSPKSPLMIVSCITGYLTESYINNNPEEPYLELNFRDVFNVYNHIHVMTNLLNVSSFDIHDEGLMPLFLSIGYYALVVQPKDQAKLKVEMLQPETIKPEVHHSGHHNPKEGNLKELMIFLDDSRFREEGYLLDICRAAVNTFEDEEEGYDYIVGLFESRRVSNELSEKVLNKYSSLKRDEIITFNTIAYYASLDSEEKFNVWLSNYYKPYYIDAIQRPTDANLAKAFYHTYFMNFLVIKGGKTWYIFDTFKRHRSHTWSLTTAASLKKFINENFKKKFELLRSKLSEEQVRNTEKDPHQVNKKKENEMLIESITEIIRKLEGNKFRDTLIEASSSEFYNEKLEYVFNKNIHITGCDNCVIEHIPGNPNLFIRPGKPEDYVNFTTGKNYPKLFTYETPIVKETMEHLRKVFIDDDLRQSFLNYSSSGFIHRNVDKIFADWCNDETSAEVGNNAKTTQKMLFEETFGEYCGGLDATYFKKRRTDPNGHTASKESIKGRIWIFTVETSAGELFDDGIMKSDTGNDRDESRAPFGERYVAFMPTHKTIHIANSTSKFKNYDTAVCSRYRPFIHKTVFKNPGDPTIPTTEEERYRKRIFPKDLELELKISDMATAFLWILVKNFPNYYRDRVPFCKTMEESYKLSMLNNDKYLQFINEMLEKVYIKGTTNPDPKYKLTLSGVSNGIIKPFTSWHKDNYASEKLPDRKTITEAFTQKLGEKHGYYWLGWRFKSDSECLEEVNELEKNFNAIVAGQLDFMTFFNFVSSELNNSRVTTTQVIDVFSSLMHKGIITQVVFLEIAQSIYDFLTPEYKTLIDLAKVQVRSPAQ